jgi:DmsE family decaheme c-type cytochrome
MKGDRVQTEGCWRIRSRLLIVSVVVLAGCVTVWRLPSQPYHRTANVVDAELVGADECEDCHDEVKERAPSTEYHADCESCHGPGSLHVESEEPEDVRYPASSDCLGCHESGRTGHLAWATGEHERAGVICSDCHDLHNREPLHVRTVEVAGFGYLDATSTLCIRCHTDVGSRLNFPSHHPVREGMLSCTDCHAPHGDRRTALGDRTTLCTGCHQDHAGPWIFEHTPVAEGCNTCHDPHGTAEYNLLDSIEPALCLSCHTVPVVHEPRARYYTRCTDCHGAIHGSYESPVLLGNPRLFR